MTAAYGDAKSVSAADLAPTASTDASSVAAASRIDVQALLNANACLGCHALKQKIVGPAYSDVAAKYRNDPQAVTKLKASIQQGGVGRWAQIPMPPFAALDDSQLKALAEFVLAQ